MMHFVRTFSIIRAYCYRSIRLFVLIAHFRLFELSAYGGKRGVGLLLSKRLEIMEKLYTSKTFSKMAGGRMHTSHPTPLDPPLAISYKNHQKSLTYSVTSHH